MVAQHMDLGLSIGGSEARRRVAGGENGLTRRSGVGVGVGVGEWARPEESNPPLQLELQLSWPTPFDSARHVGVSASPAPAAAAEGGAAVGPPDQPAGDRENIYTDVAGPSSSTSRSTGGAGGWRCSDEEGGGGGGGSEGAAPRKKLRLTKEQSGYLEESFKEHATLNPKQKLAIAKKLNLRPRQVEVWFQNRRARTKMKQTEVEYEYVKRCCESLTEENRRLRREIQELRALKAAASPRLRLHPPPAAATTLSMCPSCERAAGKEMGGRKAARSFGGAPLKRREGYPKVAFPVS